MPPAPKRNASVVLFDINTNPEFLERSRKCLLNICARKWFTKTNDCTKIILLNTAETNNSFNDKFGKCPHISEVTDVINYDPKLVDSVIKDVETGEADWLLGLAVALETIKDNYYEEAKGVMTIQLLFISDLSQDLKPKEKTIQFVIDQLNKMDVYLYILGPEVKIPNLLATFDDIREWSQNIEFIDNRDNANLEIAKKIVTNTKGIICGLSIGEELFHSYKNYWGMQPWKVPLTIGSELTLNCASVRFLKKLSAPRMKGIAEIGHYEPWKWHMVEDINEEVAYDNVIGGVFKHNKFIPLPSDVEKNFKYQGERTFRIVGFTKRVNIPEFYMGGAGAYYVENDGSKLFDLLLNTLAEQDMCAIVRKVFLRNCRPKLLALLPRITERVFLLVELPYKESINASFKEQDINQAIKLDRTEDPAIDAAYNYLQQLEITNPKNYDENGSVKWPLSAELMNDMRLKVVGERSLKKYLDKEAEITAEPDIILPNFAEDVFTLKQFIPASDSEA